MALSRLVPAKHLPGRNVKHQARAGRSRRTSACDRHSAGRRTSTPACLPLCRRHHPACRNQAAAFIPHRPSPPRRAARATSSRLLLLRSSSARPSTWSSRVSITEAARRPSTAGPATDIHQMDLQGRTRCFLSTLGGPTPPWRLTSATTLRAVTSVRIIRFLIIFDILVRDVLIVEWCPSANTAHFFVAPLSSLAAAVLSSEVIHFCHPVPMPDFCVRMSARLSSVE